MHPSRTLSEAENESDVILFLMKAGHFSLCFVYIEAEQSSRRIGCNHKSTTPLIDF